ncbi:MAG: hypothetical protein JRJ17_00450 [Deltaproteobacteria bacterium]|nr:hypothetical protein [Deltaproteobacteria bacterium]
MTNFKKHLVLVLFLLGYAGGFNCLVWAQEPLRLEKPGLPADAFSAGPGSAEVAAGFEDGEGTAETKTIHVIGRGTIYGDNVARARENAIADALQGVVEKAIGLLISPSSVVQDFQLLSDRVYNQTREFIDGYKVLIESKSGRYYRVLVRATVSMKTVQDKLSSVGIFTMHKGMPAVMFFLSEQNIGETLPQYWWRQMPPSADLSAVENVFSDYMREKGFMIVDRTALGGDAQLGPEYWDSELSDDAAAKLGRELGADLVILGKAAARYSEEVSDNDMKSIQATVSTRAITADTGLKIASSQRTNGLARRDDSTGGREAIILSASAVAQDLTRQIVAKWGEGVRHPVLVELVVKGIKEYADFVKFRGHLRNDIRGVRNVYLRSISVDGAKMDVDIMGNARILADELMLQPFENLAVNILEVSEKGVKLELVPSRTPDS